MPPDSGGIGVGVDSRDHQFAPGLPPGWLHSEYPVGEGETDALKARSLPHPSGHLLRINLVFCKAVVDVKEVLLCWYGHALYRGTSLTRTPPPGLGPS